MNHGIGDIKVLKFRDITVAGIPSKWNYLASNDNRYFRSGRRFGERTYKILADMAQDINEVTNEGEKIGIVPGKIETTIELYNARQFSNLDENESSKLAEQILLLKAKSRLEVAAQG
ncbi:MAG: hypothetical protein Q8N63_04960 [Nanoarchaeota archaeon]|nr:hypothetical protein [Nanoarchaeota archaeon]